MVAAVLVLTQLTTYPERAPMDCSVSATPAFLLQDKGMDNPLQTPRVSVFPIWGFTEALTHCKGPAIVSVFAGRHYSSEAGHASPCDALYK